MSNALVTISDNKIGVDATADNTADFYEARVLSATDYYAFGMSMKERSWQSESYRYGFNGKENDSDWEVQDYGFRIYKPEISKFLSVDPLTQSYPWYTPYQFAGNTPIQAVDLDGAEERTCNKISDNVLDWGEAKLKVERKPKYILQNAKISTSKTNIYHPNTIAFSQYDKAAQTGDAVAGFFKLGFGTIGAWAKVSNYFKGIKNFFSGSPKPKPTEELPELIDLIKDVNKSQGTYNCRSCMEASVRNIKAGEVVVSASGDLKDASGKIKVPMDSEEIFDYYNINDWITENSISPKSVMVFAGIIKHFMNAKEGTLGYVIVKYADDIEEVKTGINSHVFNVVKWKGKVVFFDSQRQSNQIISFQYLQKTQDAITTNVKTKERVKLVTEIIYGELK